MVGPSINGRQCGVKRVHVAVGGAREVGKRHDAPFSPARNRQGTMRRPYLSMVFQVDHWQRALGRERTGPARRWRRRGRSTPPCGGILGRSVSWRHANTFGRRTMGYRSIGRTESRPVVCPIAACRLTAAGSSLLGAAAEPIIAPHPAIARGRSAHRLGAANRKCPMPLRRRPSRVGDRIGPHTEQLVECGIYQAEGKWRKTHKTVNSARGIGPLLGAASPCSPWLARPSPRGKVAQVGGNLSAAQSVEKSLACFGKGVWALVGTLAEWLDDRRQPAQCC